MKLTETNKCCDEPLVQSYIELPKMYAFSLKKGTLVTKYIQ